MPGTPPSIRGVINLRGNVVPVVDLAVKFGMPARPISKRTCVVIVEVALDAEKTVMGVMADAVNQVIDLSSADIEETPSFGTQVAVDYIRGMGKVGKKFVLILDIEKLLSAKELLAAGEETAPSEVAESVSQGEEATAP